MFVNHVERPWAWHLQFRISERYFGFLGLPRWCSSKEPTCQCPCKRQDFDPRVGKIPWSRKWQPTPVFLPGKSHGQWSLAGYSLRGHKKSDTTEQLSTRFRKHSVAYGFMEILLSMIPEHFNEVLQFGGILWWISLFEWSSIQMREENYDVIVSNVTFLV